MGRPRIGRTPDEQRAYDERRREQRRQCNRRRRAANTTEDRARDAERKRRAMQDDERRQAHNAAKRRKYHAGDKGTRLTGISCLPEPTTDILFKCCFCTHVTGDQREILSHLTVHGDEQLKCQHCPKSFYRVEGLRHHSEIPKSEITFECKRCPAAYQKYAHLVNHIRIHAVEKPFKCKECPLAFS
ncbi:zinc finger protein 569-like [Ixodes scapularis]|uniref:zinc finger protein 569-like n=1 Tax=Ixodes scapularis TaxID=6945 RepID=UPI001A9DC025|nr:zinc finger protein 569-like [Ixodes scapularis]